MFYLLTFVINFLLVWKKSDKATFVSMNYVEFKQNLAEQDNQGLDN